jgi:hypothetical protein
MASFRILQESRRTEKQRLEAPFSGTKLLPPMPFAPAQFPPMPFAPAQFQTLCDVEACGPAPFPLSTKALLGRVRTSFPLFVLSLRGTKIRKSNARGTRKSIVYAKQFVSWNMHNTIDEKVVLLSSPVESRVSLFGQCRHTAVIFLLDTDQFQGVGKYLTRSQCSFRWKENLSADWSRFFNATPISFIHV